MCSYSWRVPLSAAGQLKIVPSNDIGELGPKEGTAVAYDWKWYYHISGFALLAVFVLALAVPKENRRFAALGILIPPLLLSLLWTMFRKALPFNSSQTEMFSMVIYSLVTGVAVLWLLGERIARRKGFVRFLLALAIMAGVCAAGSTAYGMMNSSQDSFGACISFSVFMLSMLIGFVLTNWRCRKHYRGWLFVLLLAVWTVVACTTITLITYTLVFLIQGSFNQLSRSIVPMVLIGAICGLIVYLISLPYVVLAFRSSFYRERFFACLGVKSLPTGPAKDSGGQNLSSAASEGAGSG